MKILITGGAGYIGSHVTLQLGQAGYDIIVYDNLSTGRAKSVLCGELIVGDLADRDLMKKVFTKHKFDTVIHFAASIMVPESVSNPLKYYSNNTCNTLGLLEMCARHGVNKLVFSSTAAVYGDPKHGVVSEDDSLMPINPYGMSKMMCERMIMDYAAASSLRYVILRYFNVAGADPQGRIGESSPDTTHLIKVACQAALGLKSGMNIFGVDYPTPDGTCIRDYIHIEDLARAHLSALEYLNNSGESTVLNCGYGHGYSVRQVVETVMKISGVNFDIRIGNRRAGDPPKLISINHRIMKTLNWQPAFNNLDTIVRDALAWEKALLMVPGK